ncbi:MAG TPA: ABC transporter permease [Phycisphaerae bacterium]|nr:ABC transporter permease [Phycisphaerae bacterium]
MLFWTIIKVCLKSLWANKLRSFLAMLGIIIGVGAVITMLAIGTGAKKAVLTRISAMGTNLLVVTPGQRGSHGVVSGTALNLKVSDALAVRDVAGVLRVAPVVNGRSQAKYANRNQPVRIVGTSITYLRIRDFQMGKGRAFTEAEVDQMARVAILGPTTAKNLFGLNEPLGQVVKIKGVNFTVIGVTKAKGDQGWFNPDDQAILPYTTAMKQMLGLDYIHEIDVQAADGADLQAVQDRITALLRKTHRLQPDAEDDFNVRNQADFIQMASQVTQTFTFLLGGVASISLLVGGIGIMNIMLVTVTERTREIGIRKAIGARERSILLQFLIETLILSGLGGLLGMGMGIAAAQVIPMFSPFSTSVDAFSIVLALSFSAAVGVFFGWYPARRAAALAPVDALRYE